MLCQYCPWFKPLYPFYVLGERKISCELAWIAGNFCDGELRFNQFRNCTIDFYSTQQNSCEKWVFFKCPEAKDTTRGEIPSFFPLNSQNEGKNVCVFADVVSIVLS